MPPEKIIVRDLPVEIQLVQTRTQLILWQIMKVELIQWQIICTLTKVNTSLNKIWKRQVLYEHQIHTASQIQFSMVIWYFNGGIAAYWSNWNPSRNL
jgi:hypothetical protein